MATTGAVRSPVTMAVMHVRNVRMRMSQRLVFVNMRVRFAGRVKSTMAMSVVLVVNMRVLVLHRQVTVDVLVVLGQMQPDAEAHEQGGEQEGHRDRRSQRYGKRGADERRQ